MNWRVVEMLHQKQVYWYHFSTAFGSLCPILVVLLIFQNFCLCIPHQQKFSINVSRQSPTFLSSTCWHHITLHTTPLDSHPPLKKPTTLKDSIQQRSWTTFVSSKPVYTFLIYLKSNIGTGDLLLCKLLSSWVLRQHMILTSHLILCLLLYTLFFFSFFANVCMLTLP